MRMQGLGEWKRMWNESRQILALIGDQAVTIAAFCALMVYGSALLLRSDTGSDLLRALITLGGAALWLLSVSAGLLENDLARWSPLAVFLFAIAVDGRATSRAGKGRGRLRGQESPHTQNQEVRTGTADLCSCSTTQPEIGLVGHLHCPSETELPIAGRRVEDVSSKAPHQQPRNSRCIASSSPVGRTVIGADRCPVASRRGEIGQEYPPGNIDIEAGIMNQPPAHANGGSSCQVGNLAHP